MSFIRKISVRGLFGLYDHSVEIRSDTRVTIIAGPNGVGKTTLFSLTQALLTADYRELGKHDFSELSVEMQDGRGLVASPLEPIDDSDESPRRLRLAQLKDGEAQSEKTVDIPVGAQDLSLPSYVEQQGPDLYFDRRSGEHLSADQLYFRYGRGRVGPRGRVGKRSEGGDEENWKVDFIETKRLDTLMSGPARQRVGRRRDSGGAPINTYLEAVRGALDNARIESTKIRQARDRNFVRRLLDKASRMTVNEPRLRERFIAIGTEAEALERNGLLTDSLDVLPQTKLNPGEKRVVSLFLDDFEAKLKPLRPVASKLERLRQVIGSKFLNKSLEIDSSGGVVFLAQPDNHQIAPESLSSGEQHQLALISRLLFTEDPGTTVLIDEPELSLHVGWQHEMVGDLIEIAEVADLTFVLATHSTAIINNRWELVEELGPLEEPIQPDSADD
jgi:energy-coupling factor transporter ATP-binding protein EcfA2